MQDYLYKNNNNNNNDDYELTATSLAIDKASAGSY